MSTTEAIDRQISRLNEIRGGLEKAEREAARLEGELESLQKRQKELEEECKAKFGCEARELEGIIKEGLEEGAKKLREAEEMLK